MGSVSGASDESGTLVMRQDYDAFGNPHDALLPGLTGPRFTGKDWDEEAGLYYFNARWYDPELGRFITEDPIRDGVNWYGYVNNRPLNLMDPSGLAVLDENGDFEVGGGRKPKKPIPEVNPVIEEEVRERKAEEDKRREEDHTRRKYGEPTTSELAAGYGFTASQGQIYLDSLQRYKDYFGKEGVSFSEIEALYWMYLDTQDPVFSDALMNNHASPFLEGALEAATDIYYSENPIEAALEHSERLAFAGYLGMAIGQQYIVASSERSRARALAAGLAAVEYEPGTPFAAGSEAKYVLKQGWKDWARYMTKRCWTENSIKEALNTKPIPHAGDNFLNPGNAMNRFVNPTTGQSLIQDSVTSEIIMLGGPGFKW